MDDSRIKDVSALLSAFFDNDTLQRQSIYSNLISSWSSISGKKLAAHSRIVDILNNLLIIEADHPGWIQLLQLRQSLILDDLAHRYPELGLRGICFRLSDSNNKPGNAIPKSPNELSELGKQSSIQDINNDSTEEEIETEGNSSDSRPEVIDLFKNLKHAIFDKE